jgi:hypothetical protein
MDAVPLPTTNNGLAINGANVLLYLPTTNWLSSVIAVPKPIAKLFEYPKVELINGRIFGLSKSI